MLHYNYETKEIGYCYDKIRLNFRTSPDELIKLLPIAELKKESADIFVGKSSNKAQIYSLYSKIEMVAPSRKCLALIDECIPHTITMKISKLEIAQDTFFETELEAYYALNTLLRTLRKKYTSKHFIYNQSYEGEKKKKNKFRSDKRLFSTVTGYFGSDNFEYVIYARLSKINDRPCIHAEWRIIGASFIKEKTGIVSIRELITFKFEKFFDDQHKQHIVHEKIDLRKLGRWLLGWGKRKSLPERKFMRMDVNGRLFCEVHNIKTYADLISHLNACKKILQKKQGPKTDYQKRFLTLSNYGMFREQVGL